jgi:multidrug efflux system outer membrane protein
MGLLKNELKISESRFKEGYTSKLDLDQIQSEYHRRASRVPDYEKQIAETEHALCLLLGRPPGPIPRGKTLDDLPELTVPAGIPADVVRQRPDVQQAEYNLIASNARIGYALGEYFPKIVLTGDAGQATTQLSNMFTPGANFWSIGSGLVMPIFTAGKIAGRVQEAEGAMTTSKADYIKSVLTAFKEVDDALVAKIKTKEQLLEETERVKANQSYFKLSKLRYDEGYEDYLVVLDALRQLFEAEIERASIKQNNLSAAIKIYRAMGGGWVGKTEKDTKVQQPTEASFLP